MVSYLAVPPLNLLVDGILGFRHETRAAQRHIKIGPVLVGATRQATTGGDRSRQREPSLPRRRERKLGLVAIGLRLHVTKSVPVCNSKAALLACLTTCAAPALQIRLLFSH